MEIGVVENWWFVENCVCIGWVNFNVGKMINMVLNLDCGWIEKILWRNRVIRLFS